MPARPAVLDRLVARLDATAWDVPGGQALIRLAVDDVGEWDVLVSGSRRELVPAEEKLRPDVRLCADRGTWSRIARDLSGGMNAFRRGRLRIRDNLHLGVGFLAATSGSTDPARLETARVRTSLGDIAVARAGDPEAPPVVMLHGLGGTKGSFLPTVAALADSYRTLAIDLPGFGNSVKPVGAAYDPRFFAKAVCDFMDACGLDSAHLVGNSMGGRVALEVGFRHPDRVERIVGLAASPAWRRDRRWAPLVKALRPELGSSSSRRGRAPFYAALRHIYLDEPEGEEGFWTRLRSLESDSLFVWGRTDRLVPIAFARHVREALPRAQHLELECGHVPQLEAPQATHAAVRRFLGAARRARAA